jgi:hypothetical protein
MREKIYNQIKTTITIKKQFNPIKTSFTQKDFKTFSKRQRR